MIDEFVNVEDEDSKPPKLQLKIIHNAHLIKSLKVFLNEDFPNPDYIGIELTSNPILIPFGSLFINENAVIKKGKSGTWFYHPLLKNRGNWEYWGWLADNRKLDGYPKLSEYLKKEFAQLEILKIDHRPPNSTPTENELNEDLKKDCNIPYRADRLLSENFSPSCLQEFVLLNNLITGKQVLGPSECQILWKRREYISREMANSLPIFLQSLNWKSDDELGQAGIALVMISENWSPITISTLVKTMNIIDKIPKELISQFDNSLLQLVKKSKISIETLLEELLISEAYNDYSDLVETIKYLKENFTLKYVGKQFEWANHLVQIADTVRQNEATRQARTLELREALTKVTIRQEITRLPFFHRNNEEIIGIAADRSIVFKSNAMPVKVSLVRAEDCEEVQVLVKSGEDIKNDQWVMAIIDYLKLIWKEHGLVELSESIISYGVYPYNKQQNPEPEIMGGIIEYIASSSLSVILEDGSIDGTPNFVNSCAGYTILTWLLGVGDRHLDNLLITTTRNRLFHVDYAYLFGADPKPFAPPMKLCKEMVQAISDINYFKKLMLAALRVIQMHGDVFLGAVEKGFGKKGKIFVEERLFIEDGRLMELIDESARSVLPQVMDTIHKWAQYWKP
jgi:phosphatidylinositol 3-kinase